MNDEIPPGDLDWENATVHEPLRPDWRKAPSFRLWLRHPWRCLGVWVRHDPNWRPWK